MGCIYSLVSWVISFFKLLSSSDDNEDADYIEFYSIIRYYIVALV
jgi:hypothetical protein